MSSSRRRSTTRSGTGSGTSSTPRRSSSGRSTRRRASRTSRTSSSGASGSQAEPGPLSGFTKHVLETREPLLIVENMDAESERYGSTLLAGEAPKSVLFIPLVAGGKATGVISLQNIDREHAFDEADQQLLTTVAGSLSVALENARLVEETRQRVSELATVNSVGQALSSQLDLEVADRARRRAGARDVRGRHRLRRAARPAVGADRLRLLLRERRAQRLRLRSPTAKG